MTPNQRWLATRLKTAADRYDNAYSSLEAITDQPSPASTAASVLAMGDLQTTSTEVCIALVQLLATIAGETHEQSYRRVAALSSEALGDMRPFHNAWHRQLDEWGDVDELLAKLGFELECEEAA